MIRTVQCPATVIILSRWLLLITVTGALTGSACALFLSSLAWVTRIQSTHNWLIWLLPLGGLVSGAMYSRWGRTSEAGNNVIFEEIHHPRAGVPPQMAPLVLLGTLLTHLFGGSAGREGTAVQMGGSLAGSLGRLFPSMSSRETAALLSAGIAAGFSGVFGTPLAGTVFALEVLVVGRILYQFLIPCLVTAYLSDSVCTWWGVGHTHYSVTSQIPEIRGVHLNSLEPSLLIHTLAAAVLFGMAARIFVAATHFSSAVLLKLKRPLLRPVAGSAVIVSLMFLAGDRSYLGLGVESEDPQLVTIVSAFRDGGAQTMSWLWKIVFTSVTLGSGFKGGEVTPLFYVGATLGNAFAAWTGNPADLFAALGFVAVFSAAAKTPLACSVMAVELFGAEYVHYFAIACTAAWLSSGRTGIYRSQRASTDMSDPD